MTPTHRYKLSSLALLFKYIFDLFQVEATLITKKVKLFGILKTKDNH